MLLTASGLFFTRKIGDLKKGYVRRMSAYYSRKIKKYELLSNAVIFSFMVLALGALAAKQLEGNEIVKESKVYCTIIGYNGESDTKGIVGIADFSLTLDEQANKK